MSTITSLQEIDSDTYREGVNILTYQQFLRSPIARMRPNSPDILVHAGRPVSDNFFDENLLDMGMAGSITNAPSPYLEVRTLGDADPGSPGFTDMTDFQPVAYLLDEGTVMYPSVMNAGGFSDPIRSSGIVGMFESRAEIAVVNPTPGYAKRGVKASPCWTAEGADRKNYAIEQLVPRSYSAQEEKSPAFFEVGAEDIFCLLGTVTYPDTLPTPAPSFVDSCDSCLGSSVRDPQISAVLSAGTPGSPYIQRDKVSSTAGWTILNKANGTDSIVYSDRT